MLPLILFNDKESDLQETLDEFQLRKQVELEAIRHEQEERLAAIRQQFDADLAVVQELEQNIAKEKKKQRQLTKEMRHETKYGARLRKVGKLERKGAKKQKSLHKVQHKVQTHEKNLQEWERDIQKVQRESQATLTCIAGIAEMLDHHGIAWDRLLTEGTQSPNTGVRQRWGSSKEFPKPPPRSALRGYNQAATASGNVFFARLSSHRRIACC